MEIILSPAEKQQIEHLKNLYLQEASELTDDALKCIEGFKLLVFYGSEFPTQSFTEILFTIKFELLCYYHKILMKLYKMMSIDEVLLCRVKPQVPLNQICSPKDKSHVEKLENMEQANINELQLNIYLRGKLFTYYYSLFNKMYKCLNGQEKKLFDHLLVL